MVKLEIDMQQYQPIPIARIIQTANTFNCDIFMDFEADKAVDVKSYDALKNGWKMQVRQPIMYFCGKDELEAQISMLRLFVISPNTERKLELCRLS